MVMTRRGALIVLEGCDRAGKSTQANLLLESVKRSGRPIRLMNFPDRRTAVGKLIDQYLKKQIEMPDETIHLLFSANRWELVPEINGALEKGETVIVDRYAYSGIAFSAAKGLDLEWCRSCDVGLPQPDAVIFLNLEKETASQRGDFGQERYENIEFQEKVMELYMKLKDDSYWQVIEANRPIESVHEDCHKIVVKAIEEKAHQPVGLLWKKF